jgi:hypothetical protein
MEGSPQSRIGPEQGWNMSNLRGAPLMALMLALFTQPVEAFWEPPYVTPAHPTANDVVSVNEHLGVCDAFYSSAGYPHITQSGNDIKIVSAGIHLSPGDDGCNLITGTITYSLGSFPAGDYSVTYYMRYQSYFGEILDLNLGVTRFTVAAIPAAAESVPTLTKPGISILALALLALAISGISKANAELPAKFPQRRGSRRQMK